MILMSLSAGPSFQPSICLSALEPTLEDASLTTLFLFLPGVRSVDAKTGENVLYNMERPINEAVFPGLQGGPHNHQIAGVAVALKQCLTPAYKEYQKQVSRRHPQAVHDDRYL